MRRKLFAVTVPMFCLLGSPAPAQNLDWNDFVGTMSDLSDLKPDNADTFGSAFDAATFGPGPDNKVTILPGVIPAPSPDILANTNGSFTFTDPSGNTATVGADEDPTNEVPTVSADGNTLTWANGTSFIDNDTVSPNLQLAPGTVGLGLTGGTAPNDPYILSHVPSAAPPTIVGAGVVFDPANNEYTIIGDGNTPDTDTDVTGVQIVADRATGELTVSVSENGTTVTDTSPYTCLLRGTQGSDTTLTFFTGTGNDGVNAVQTTATGSFTVTNPGTCTVRLILEQVAENITTFLTAQQGEVYTQCSITAGTPGALSGFANHRLVGNSQQAAPSRFQHSYILGPGASLSFTPEASYVTNNAYSVTNALARCFTHWYTTGYTMP